MRDLGQVDDPAVEPPDDEGADGEKGDELDDRFDGDGENETVLMLLGVDAPGAERHREGREHHGHREIKRGRGRVRRQPLRGRTNSTTINTVGATALSWSAT